MGNVSGSKSVDRRIWFSLEICSVFYHKSEKKSDKIHLFLNFLNYVKTYKLLLQYCKTIVVIAPSKTDRKYAVASFTVGVFFVVGQLTSLRVWYNFNYQDRKSNEYDFLFMKNTPTKTTQPNNWQHSLSFRLLSFEKICPKHLLQK